jgi:methyl-accepting chemotaxis protein
MVLLFLAASATILSVIAIALILLRRQEGMPPLTGGTAAAMPSLVLPAVAGIILIAWLASRITSSVNRSLGECARFAQSLADGRLDARLPLPGAGEAAPLATALNAMAESIHLRISRASAHSAALVSMDGELQTGSARMAHAVRLQEADLRRLVPGVVRMEQTLTDLATGMENLLTSASATADASRDLVAGIESMAATGTSLGASSDEVRDALTRMSAHGRGTNATIPELLALSGSSAASGARMDAIIGQIERGTREARAIAEGITGDAETGRQAAHEAIAGMQAIRTASAATAQAMENLRKRTGDIGTILAVIEDVAEQTDLLALNATIIAAQAGEMGRDFSVVADEIRELAERTSSSTREIAVVIHGVQEETRRAVEAIRLVEERITTGERLSQHAGTALVMIVGGVQQAALQVGGIARDGMEQARVSREIREAVEQITAMAQRIAESSAEQSRCADLALSTAERMGELTAQARSQVREQRHNAALAQQAAATMTNNIRQLRDAGAPLLSGSAPPSAALAALQTSTASGSDALRTVESDLTALTRQTRLLKEELTEFKT